MIDEELKARIRSLFHAEHWKIGTIASQLGLHYETVRLALDTSRFNNNCCPRRSLVDPFLPFIEQNLRSYPRLRATRLLQMLKDRGYQGSISQLRRAVALLRPSQGEAFLKLSTIPGEQAQVDWASFGTISIGRARRRLSCFVMTLSWSRALYLEFFLDQTLENFLLGHVHAFTRLKGAPRCILTDNLKSAVIERFGDSIRFHPRLLELAGHYHFIPRPCQPRRGNEKGRVERAIQYIRHSFFAARSFSSIEDLNRQALSWRDEVADSRPWPDDDRVSVREAFEHERQSLLPLAEHPFETDLVRAVHSQKTIYVRFDLNDYSIPPEYVHRPLTLVASPSRVRLFYADSEIASHPRSFDRHQQIQDPSHIEAVVRLKKKALGATASARLRDLIPAADRFIEAAFKRGEGLSQITKELLQQIDDYGAGEVAEAVKEALDHNTPSTASVSFILRRRRRVSHRPAASALDLSRHPELENLSVPAGRLEIYDELTEKKIQR